MITGTWRERKNYQMHGQASQDSLYWTKGHLTDVHGRRRDLRGNKRPQDPTMYGQRFGSICPMPRQVKICKSVLSRNQSSTMPEDCVVFTSLILMMRNSRISWKMLGESLKFRCQHQCLVDFNVISTGKQNKIRLYCWADESMRKRMEGSPHRERKLNHHDLVHKFIPMPQVSKIPDARAACNENTRCQCNSGERIGKTGKFGMAADESQKQKWGDRWSKE